jgi:membrane fusion protein, multidrug efflux system
MSASRKMRLRRREAMKTLGERRGYSVFGPEAYREYIEGPEMRNESCSQGISIRSRRKMHFSGSTRRNLRGGLWLLLVVVGAVSPGCTVSDSESRTQEEDSREAPRVVQVSVMTAEPTSIEDILVLPGETEAWQDVRLSAEQSGVVEWIGVQEGAKVRKGDLLAKINVASLKAGLDRAEAAYQLTDALYQRRKRLAERKIINQEALDHSQTDRSVASGDLEQARLEYEKGFVRAPVDGRINRLFVDKGEFINRGEPLLDLVNVDKVEIDLNVPEMDVRFFQPGQKAGVRVDALPDLHKSGVVAFVAYRADPGTKSFPVKVLVENPGHEIRPGMIARVSLVRRVIPDAMLVPLFVLVDKGGERLLFVEEDGVARARTVELGVISGDRVQILKGLAPGDRLIVKGQTEVEEGMKVKVP